MDIVNYVRTLVDKLGEHKKPSTDYSDTEKKIAEITGATERGRLPADPDPIERKTYDRVEYTPASDEEIEKAAKAELYDYDKSGREGIDNEIAALVKSYSDKREKAGESYDQTMKNIDAAYKRAVEAAEADAIRRGLARSSIAALTVSGLEGDRAEKETAASDLKTRAEAEIDAAIGELEAKKQKALADFNLSYLAKLTTQIEKKKEEREKAKLEAAKYNNSLSKQENSDEIAARRLENELRDSALKRKEKENELIDKPSETQKNYESEMIYVILREKLLTMDKITARNEVNNNPLFGRYLNQSDYYKLYEEFGR